MQSLSMTTRLRTFCAACLLAFNLTGCGVNEIPTQEEHAKAAWGEVENQYQRRADLVPNLVETVKGYAAHEKEERTVVLLRPAEAPVAEQPGSRTPRR